MGDDALKRDGLAIRPIRPTDKQLLAAGLGALSPESRRARFLVPKPRLTAAELRYLTEVDGGNHFALVAVRDDDASQLVAVVRYIRLADEPTTAEMAIVVADPWQGRGVGRRLSRVLADHARDDGVTRFTGLTLSDNVAAHRVFAGLGGAMTSQPQGTGVDQLFAELAA